jgi:hypothetical protein
VPVLDAQSELKLHGVAAGGGAEILALNGYGSAKFLLAGE